MRNLNLFIEGLEKKPVQIGKRMDPQGPKWIGLFGKGLFLWKIYIMSGTTWFHLQNLQIILLKLIPFMINDPAQ